MLHLWCKCEKRRKKTTIACVVSCHTAVTMTVTSSNSHSSHSACFFLTRNPNLSLNNRYECETQQTAHAQTLPDNSAANSAPASLVDLLEEVWLKVAEESASPHPWMCRQPSSGYWDMEEKLQNVKSLRKIFSSLWRLLLLSVLVTQLQSSSCNRLKLPKPHKEYIIPHLAL